MNKKMNGQIAVVQSGSFDLRGELPETTDPALRFDREVRFLAC
jgi:hypothetical protein